jgi:hypothetical protein
MPVPIPLLWTKDGYKILWAGLFARTELMTKASSGMKLIKSRFLIPLF